MLIIADDFDEPRPQMTRRAPEVAHPWEQAVSQVRKDWGLGLYGFWVSVLGDYIWDYTAEYYRGHIRIMENASYYLGFRVLGLYGSRA